MSNTTKDGFSAAEKAAMKERAAELRAEAKAGKRRAEGESAVAAKIAEMPPADRDLAERFHAIVAAVAPQLEPKTWYGMPAYARDGKVVCFFKPAEKFESRYATIGFEDAATLDEGALWATSYAVTPALSTADEELIAARVRRAAG